MPTRTDNCRVTPAVADPRVLLWCRKGHLPGPTGFDDLMTTAVSRLMLDNFDHIKAYWIMVTPRIAQTALNMGADCIDGTVVEEKVVHMAGARTPVGLTLEELKRQILAAGRVPVQRDSLYNEIERFDASVAAR